MQSKFIHLFTGNESNCFKIVKLIMERSFAPVIVFSFSKKDCEAYATKMAKLDFNTGETKVAWIVFYSKDSSKGDKEKNSI